eukprot:c18354_g1_i1.p1 GENE.c18354_g1_i1~~c18354_g1_i1.p1  ORF type:complete len:367 (-),score=160.06 c18354_g1_i1:77-1177(-)
MRGKGIRKGTVSKRKAAGIIFPIARIKRSFKSLHTASRISPTAAVYTAAVLEYLTAEVMELAGNCAQDMKKKRILPRHILLALKGDDEFNKLVVQHKITVASGGVQPNILSKLLPASADTMDSVSSPGPASPVQKQAKKAKKPVQAKKPKKVAKSDADNSSEDEDAAPAANSSLGPIKRAPTSETLGAKKLFLGQNLKIVKSNLGKYQHADAIVHPTNGSYSTSGMVGQELERHGGSTFVSEMNRKPHLKVTECSITGGGNLHAKHVIHCHSPSWSGDNSISQLKKTIENILTLADKEGLGSVALPSIGSGANGFPKDDAARAILQAIHAYFQGVMSSSLKEVHFVLFDDESIDVYNKVYRHEFPE